jgi:hypothetical protein
LRSFRPPVQRHKFQAKSEPESAHSQDASSFAPIRLCRSVQTQKSDKKTGLRQIGKCESKKIGMFAALMARREHPVLADGSISEFAVFAKIFR